MIPNSILINNMSAEELNSKFDSIQSQINGLKEYLQPKLADEYLTRNEVSMMLKCDLSTIHNWTKKGKLIPYCIGGRVYYKRSQIELALIPLTKNKILL